jgi:hypothetical protein
MDHSSTLASALEHLSTSIAVDPQNPQLYVQRGMVSFRLGEVAASIDDFE